MTSAPAETSSQSIRISGTDYAKGLRERLAQGVAQIKAAHGFTPCLAVVLVGTDPASEVYVRSKGEKTVEAGMESVERKLPEETSQEELMKVVRELNADPDVHGILVQMPLPKHIDTDAVLDAIDSDKDVDGLGPINTGYLALGRDGLVPCTPQGSIMLIKDHLGVDLSGLNAVVVGRSILVGKPVAQLLLAENCTVTIAHSRTKDLAEVCARADILVAAVGRPKMLTGEFIKPGATVIDVGINRIPAPEKGEGKTRLVGDVDYDAAQGIAGAITPVPGGVGPMTIACLLRNTVLAACRQKDVPVPEGV